MISAEKSIYISYSWCAEKKYPLVDELLAALDAKGIEVKRDSNAINPYDSIRAYMDELATGGAIILLLSDEYFKSRNCMYELREIYLNNRKEFRKRIFPVVLKGTKFHSAAERIPYIKHWAEETSTLNDKLSSVSREDLSAVSHNELRDYADFRRMIDDLLALISDMCSPTQEEHLKTGFSALIERIFSQPEPDGGGGKDKTGKTTNIGQNTTGNDNIFSGSGNITVNNININAAETAPQPEKEDSSDVGFKLKIAYNIPNLPPNYLPRPEYIDEFRAALQKESIGLTGAAHLGVEGMGGIGKSVLAAALAHDEAVQAAFPDGIFWLTFGQKVEDAALLVQQNNILKLLGQQEQEISLDLSRHQLTKVLRWKKCLFIIDDIWESRHLKCFDLSGTDCRFLLTSRKADVLDQLDMERKRIDLLSEEQALVMLAQYAHRALAILPKEAKQIIKECGYLPLAVAAVGSMVRNKPADRWQLALRKLQEAKLDKIACKFDYQYKNIFRALQVSVEALPEAQQQYYKTLAVFPEDTEIPESVVVMYWNHCAFSDDEPQDVIDALVEAALIIRIDDNFLRLHDLLRDYLISQTEDITAVHKQLLEAYNAEYPGGWHTIPCEEPYYFHHRWYFHFQEAGESTQLNEIADALIFQQHELDMTSLQIALEFVNYQLSDVADHLLKENHNPVVLTNCLKNLGDKAKGHAKRLLETNQNFSVVYNCLKILKNEAKEEAKRLLKEKYPPQITTQCLEILGKEAKEEARKLLKESGVLSILRVCLNILGDEAKMDALRLLKESKDELVIETCLHFLGHEAKKEAKRLITENHDDWIKMICLDFLGNEAEEEAKKILKNEQSPYIINSCLNILGNQAKEDAARLLKVSNNSIILRNCIRILGDEAKSDAKRLLHESNDKSLLNACYKLIGDEAKEDARQLLKKSHEPNVLAICLKILGKEAKKDAKNLLKKCSHLDVLVISLQLLGDEAKEEARKLIKENKNEWIILECLKILQGEAREDARRWLRLTKNEPLIWMCIRILGKDAKKAAIQLSTTCKNEFIRKPCLQLLASWDNSSDSNTIELA